MPSSSGLLPCPSGELYGAFTTNFVTIRRIDSADNLKLVRRGGWKRSRVRQ